MSTDNREQHRYKNDYERVRASQGKHMFAHLARQARTEKEQMEQQAEVAALAQEIEDDASTYVSQLGKEQAVHLREKMNSGIPFHAYFLLNDKTSQEMHEAFATEAQLPIVDTNDANFSLEVAIFSFDGTDSQVVRRIALDDTLAPYAVHYELAPDKITLPQ